MSLGAFVDVLTPDVKTWRGQILRLRTLPGLRHIEVWLEHLPSPFELAALQEALEGVAILVHGPFVDVNLSSAWGEQADLSLRRTLRAIAVAEALGARVFTIHAGKFSAYEDHEAALLRFANNYRVIASRARNMVVAVENLKAKQTGVSRECVATLGDMQQLASYATEVAFTLDVGHALQNSESPHHLLETLAPRIGNVHLHDASREGRSHRALGTGELDVRSVLRQLDRIRPAFVTLEMLGWNALEDSWGRVSAELAALADTKP